MSRGAQSSHTTPGHGQRVELGHIQQALSRRHDNDPDAAFVENVAEFGPARQIKSEHIASSTKSIGRHLVGPNHRYTVGFGELLVKVAQLQIVSYVDGNLSDVVAAVLGARRSIAVSGRESVLRRLVRSEVAVQVGQIEVVGLTLVSLVEQMDLRS